MKKANLFGQIFIGISLILVILWIADLFIFASRVIQSDHQRKEITVSHQFLHPYYYFFYPSDKTLLDRINKDILWVDDRGFGGGVGPENRGDRKLAFLLGGSTAFGAGASHPNNSVAPVLNRLQEKYFFVNAGVSSWNSFQELIRLIKQVIPYGPKLVISLTSYNDIVNAYDRRHLDIPTDSPESFETLYNWVEDIRAPGFRKKAVTNYLVEETVFGVFTLYNLRMKLFSKEEEGEYEGHALYDPSVNEEDFSFKVAKNIHQNLLQMKKLSEVNGIEYKAILQPNKLLNPNFFKPSQAGYRKVIQEIMSHNDSFILDFTDPFPRASKETLESIYTDPCHFNDRGYELLAQKILKVL